MKPKWIAILVSIVKAKTQDKARRANLRDEMREQEIQHTCSVVRIPELFSIDSTSPNSCRRSSGSILCSCLPCPIEAHPLSNRKENGSPLRSRVAREWKSNSHRSCFVVKAAMVLIWRRSAGFAILRVRILNGPLSLL